MRNSLLLFFLLIVGFSLSCGKEKDRANTEVDKIETTTETTEEAGSVEETIKDGEKVMVKISTNKGDITIELDAEKAPITVENFIMYAEEGFYNETIFHRVIPKFMIQGGGFSEDMTQKPPKEPIKNEAENGLINDRGTIAMARTSVVDSATSQFFINLVNNDFLNHGARDFGYAVFGKVTEGMEVVDKIGGVGTGVVGRFRDVPTQPVIIKSVTVIKE